MVLVFEGVCELTINDPERVGFYDINKLKYNCKESSVQILGNIPVNICVQMKNCNNIKVEDLNID